MKSLRFPAARLPGLFLAICLCFSSGSRAARAEESLSADERMSRMESEIRALQEENRDLEVELRSLQQSLGADEDGAPETAHQGVVEAESPARKPQPDESPTHEERHSEPYRGFHFTSQDGRHGLELGGRITGRFTGLSSDHPLDRRFSVERARLFANAHLYDHYSLRIQVEFAEEPRLKDGYLEVHYVPWARFMLGQFKIPFSLEYQQSHKYIDFAERSIAVDGMRFEGRDIGAMLHGRLAGGIFDYQLAVTSGKGENRPDDNSAKDLAGRIVLRPFRGVESRLLSGLHLGASGTWGDQDTPFDDVELLTLAGTPFVSFEDGTELDGTRSRAAAEFAWLIGPASLRGEWIWMWLDDFRSPTAGGDFQADSWYVSASYLLTREEKSLERIAPRRPFNPFRGGWGAWEIAARYSRFDTDDDLFRLGMASGTSRADAVDVGLSWYLHELFRVTLTYEHVEFEEELEIEGETETLDDEDAFLVQCQLEF